MRNPKIDASLFIQNREHLKTLLQPNALAVVNANDLLPTNADGTLPLKQNSDLFYLTGVNQEESILLLYPMAPDPEFQEILFVRQPNEHLATWEGHKLDKEEAKSISGIRRVEWLSEFDQIFHRLMCECEKVYLNSNEHKRAVVEVETRDARFVQRCRERYPLHDYHRLARLLHTLRAVKSQPEIELIKKACAITKAGFERVLGFLKPGVTETEVEAELAHEYIRRGGTFAYNPIIATGPNACVLHYNENRATCRKGEMILLDVASTYSNYNSDLTRTVPVSGRFSKRQKAVYNAVLHVMRESIQALKPGLLVRDWQRNADRLMEEQLLKLGLLKPSETRRKTGAPPAFKKFFMHGLGHPIGLDVHDVGHTTEPMQAGWVMTVEPGIYIREEGFGIRLENDVLITADGRVDLMADIPVEVGEIEDLMNRGR